MSTNPRILYLGVPDASLVHGRKYAGICRYAAMRGWNVVSAPLPENGAMGVPALLKTTKPAGCVAECSGKLDFIPRRVFGSVPVVYLDSPPDPRPSERRCVSIDDEAIARIAFHELSGWHPVSVAVVEREIPSHWSRARSNAFRRIAASEEIPCRVFASRRGEAIESRIGRLSLWLARLPGPCGVFATNDNTASAVVKACRMAHLHIPKDVALVGVDDEAANNGPDRPLSSIQVDFEHAGALAAKMLGEIISHGGTEARSQRKQTDLLTPNGAREEVSRVSGEQIRLLDKNLSGSVAPCDKNHFTVGPLMVVRRKSTSGRGRQIPCMDAALSIIRHEACDGLTARALAARFPGTRRHFDRRFREATGHSVLDEILHVRMESAFRLLAGTDVPVGAVADFCGFGCYQELDRLFRSRCGMSMSEWRRRNAAFANAAEGAGQGVSFGHGCGRAGRGFCVSRRPVV